MKNGAIWITGLIFLLFAFVALEFRSMQKAQTTAADQYAKLAEAVQALQGGPKTARVRGAAGQKAGAEDKSVESVLLDLQNFMRDMRSKQAGVERRISDLDDRINRERETILEDLKVFLEDMRAERKEFAGEISRLRLEMAEDSPQTKKIGDILDKIEAKIEELGKMVAEDTKRREEIYQQETEGIRIQGTISGPGERTTY